MTKHKPIEIGDRFNRLLVLDSAGRSKSGKKMWACLCVCGIARNVIGNNLKTGTSKSCGCLNSEILTARSTHGKADTGIYFIWRAMLSRCNNPKNKGFHNYGGRGIFVCDRWLKFENFFEDMGEKPKNLSLDRLDNNKGYSPDNCKWATRREQSCNTRQNLPKITLEGITKSISDWARHLEIKPSTIRSRFRKGISDPLKLLSTTPLIYIRATGASND